LRYFDIEINSVFPKNIILRCMTVLRRKMRILPAVTTSNYSKLSVIWCVENGVCWSHESAVCMGKTSTETQLKVKTTYFHFSSCM
jgi:hypothetical protein